MVFFNGFPFSYRHTSKRWHRFAHYFRHCYRTGFTLSTFLAPSLLKQIVRPDVQYRPGNKHSGRMQFTVQLLSGGNWQKFARPIFQKLPLAFQHWAPTVTTLRAMTPPPAPSFSVGKAANQGPVVHSRGSTFQAAGALSCRSENKFVFHRTITILCVSACANSAKLIDTLRWVEFLIFKNFILTCRHRLANWAVSITWCGSPSENPVLFWTSEYVKVKAWNVNRFLLHLLMSRCNDTNRSNSVQMALQEPISGRKKDGNLPSRCRHQCRCCCLLSIKSSFLRVIHSVSAQSVGQDCW